MALVCTALGRLLKRQANHTLKTKPPHINVEDVLLWEFRAKDSLDGLRDACEHLGFDSDSTAIYQVRHGGASRDLMLGTRTTQDVTPRGFWAWFGQHA